METKVLLGIRTLLCLPTRENNAVKCCHKSTLTPCFCFQQPSHSFFYLIINCTIPHDLWLRHFCGKLKQPEEMLKLKPESSVKSNLALVLYKYEIHKGKLSLVSLYLKHTFSMVYFIFPLCIQTFYLFHQGFLQQSYLQSYFCSYFEYIITVAPYLKTNT